MPELLQFDGLPKARLLPEDWIEGQNSDGDPTLDTNAVVFYVGKHRGQMYTREDLQAVVDRFVTPTDEEDYGDAPIQLDHSMSTLDTVGSVRRLWMDGDELKARLRFEGANEVKAVRRRRWKRLSSGFWVDKDPKTKKEAYTLAEVSVTPFPELKRASTYTHQEEEEKPMPEPVEKAPAPAPEPPKKLEQFTDDHPALTRMRQDFLADQKAREEKFAAELKQRDEKHAADLAAERKEREKISKVLRFAELTRKIETFQSTGKSVPAATAQELALLETFSDEQLELYGAYKEACPAYVAFGVEAEQEAKAPPKTDNVDGEMTQEQADEEAASLLDQFSTQKKAKVA